jgi:DNA replication protein DnaD
MLANHQGREWEFKGEKYKAAPGQFITSLESLAQKCGKGVSIQNVRTSLKRFEKYDFLTNESTNKNRLITIVNWGFYQFSEDELTSNPTSNQQATNKQLTTNKNVKNVKNEKKIKYDEFVSMKLEEYEKLIEQFGESGTKERIVNLNLYKGSKGIEYKNDYLTILAWERKNNKAKPQQRKKADASQFNLED